MNEEEGATVGFPQTLEDLRPVEFSGDDDAVFDAVAEEVRAIPPRSHGKYPPMYFPELLQAYIREANLPPGRYFIYGTGTLPRDAFPALKDASCEVAGFLDRNAGTITECCGLPVLLPEQVVDKDFDHILTPHLLDEPVMRERLVKAGVEDRKIVAIQTDPRYHIFVLKRVYPILRRRYAEQVSCVIVSSLAAHWSIVPHETLARIFPPEETVNLFQGSLGQIETYKDDVFPVVPCMQSTELLIQFIRDMSPRVVYLKTSPHAFSEHIFLAIKHEFPEIIIINEINDWSSLFSDVFMKESLLYSDRQLAIARYANYAALRRADLVVCKSGGPAWDRLNAHFPVPCRTYFPLLGDADRTPPPAPPPRGRDEPIRVLFAGTIGIDETPDDSSRSQGSNFLQYFKVLCSSSDIALDIFNSGHMSERNSQAYEPLLAFVNGLRQSGGQVAYHPCRPFSELMETAWQWDFGLAASHYAKDRVENVTRVGIGNKLMGYIAAGIPAVIDNRYGFASALIERYEAGIVLDPARLEDLPALLRAADHERLRAGMRRLRAHLIETNTRLAETIAATAR